MATILPADLAHVIDDCDTADRRADTLVSGLSESQLNWQSEPGRSWSIGQCLDHLATMNSLYTEAMQRALSTTIESMTSYRPIRPGWFARWFIRSLEPPPRIKMRSPNKGVPKSTVSKASVLRAFLDSQEVVRSTARACATLDPNAVRFVNPFIRQVRVSMGAGLLILSAHTRRHLWQAERVRERADFPK